MILVNRKKKWNLSQRFHLKSRTFMQWMVFLVTLWSFFIETLGELPGVFKYFKYLADAILLLSAILAVGKSRIRIKRTMIPLVGSAAIFLIYTIVVYLLRFQSLFYYLWGFRNTYRFLIAFFVFNKYLGEEDITSWFRIMDVLFWINFVLSVIQFAFMDIRQDFLGGIFGIDGGSNGATLCFLCVVIGRSLLSAFSGKEKTSSCILKFAASLLIAAMAEMKFYFFLCVFILVVAAALTRFSWKTILVLVLATVLVIQGAVILTYWFTDSLDFFSWESLWERATKENYSTANDLNRLAAIPKLASSFLTSPVDQLIGLGLGNCDMSAFAVCNTPFYVRYSYLHYLYFMAPTLFLETGLLGLIFYLSFFITVVVVCNKKINAGEGDRLYCQLAIIIALVCVLFAFYNASLRNEAAYMLFFVLSMPFLEQKKRHYPESKIDGGICVEEQ